MPETDAIVLDNWFPSATSVDVRKGHSSFATFTGDCLTTIIYNGTSTEVFVAVDTTDDAIYDATSGGALSSEVVGGSTPTVQAVTSARFDYQNFGTTAGQFLTLVNGEDTPLEYDGSDWSASTMTGTGLTTSDLFTAAVYAERLWYGESGTFNVWYLGTGAVTGTLTKLNLGSVFKLGGALSNIVTWSADTGSLLADFIGFISTEGEVVAYSGTDPSSASTWSRVAQFRIGRPIVKGNRAWTRVGSDALVLTVDGLVSMVGCLVRDRLGRAVSDKIRNALLTDIATYGALNDWCVELHPAGQKLLINVPIVASTTSRQYVMNSQTQAWCRFTGWNAFCLAADKSNLYFGGHGILAKADTGTDDNDEAITANAKQAFSYLGQRGRIKQMTMARPILSLDGPVNLGLGINVDYQDSDPGSTVPIAGNAGDPWATSWDYTWAGAAITYRSWNSVRGIGTAIAPRMKIQASGVNVSWSATDYVYQFGGIL